MRADRQWRIRFAAFCGVYAALLVSPLAGQANHSILETLARLGGVYAFAFAPVMAMAGLSLMLFGRVRWIILLIGAPVLAFLTLSGHTLALEVTLIAALGWLGAVLGKLMAVIAALSLLSNLGAGAAMIGPLGDILGTIGGQTVLANVVIVVAAVLVPLLAERAGWS